MRTIDVPDLGWNGALVSIEGETLLLMDAGLSWDQRMDVMGDAMVVSDHLPASPNSQ